MGKKETVRKPRVIGTSPDSLLRDFLSLGQAAERMARRSVRNRRQTKKLAYKQAKLWMVLVGNHYTWLIEVAQASGGIDKLLEDGFMALTTIGERYRTLLTEVADGLTEKQYLGSVAGSRTREKALARLAPPPPEEKPPGDGPKNGTPDPNPEKLDRDDLIAMVWALTDRNRTLEDEARIANGKWRELHKLCREQEKMLQGHDRLMGRLEKDVAKLKLIRA